MENDMLSSLLSDPEALQNAMKTVSDLLGGQPSAQTEPQNAYDPASEMMQKELDHRKLELMPELIEEVKRTRAFGDLSENFEYKAAKQAQNRNRSRIRYLERMIKSAHVIEDKAGADEVGLFDKVELLFEDDDDTDTIQVVTTVRCDPLNGRISCKAPLGKAVLGKKVGDQVDVTTEEGDSYTVVIKSITKEKDDGLGPIL